jgi:hypothetical protein
MLVLEPILLLLTLYMALIYGILYLFFTAYPTSFQEERKWNSGVGALPFLGITIGVLIGGAIIAYVTKTRFARKLKQQGQVVPEERLPPMILELHSPLWSFLVCGKSIRCVSEVGRKALIEICSGRAIRISVGYHRCLLVSQSELVSS